MFLFYKKMDSFRSASLRNDRFVAWIYYCRSNKTKKAAGQERQAAFYSCYRGSALFYRFAQEVFISPYDTDVGEAD